MICWSSSTGNSTVAPHSWILCPGPGIHRTSPRPRKHLKAATAILTRIAGLSTDDRQRIGAKVEQLRSRLDQVPAYANVRSYPASVAS